MDILKQLLGNDISDIINRMLFPNEIFEKVLDDIKLKKPYICFIENCHFSTTKLKELTYHLSSDRHIYNFKDYIKDPENQFYTGKNFIIC